MNPHAFTKKERATIVISVLLLVGYFMWLGFTLPNSLKQKTLTCDVVTETKYGYDVIGLIGYQYEIHEVHLHLDKLLFEDIVVGNHLTITFRTGFTPFHWKVIEMTGGNQ